MVLGQKHVYVLLMIILVMEYSIDCFIDYSDD